MPENTKLPWIAWKEQALPAHTEALVYMDFHLGLPRYRTAVYYNGHWWDARLQNPITDGRITHYLELTKPGEVVAAVPSPLLDLYQRIEAGLPDKTILFMRLGDFYEVYLGNAKFAAKILGVALAKRNGVDLCSIPLRAYRKHFKKMLLTGYTVALYDSDNSKPIIIKRMLTDI